MKIALAQINLTIGDLQGNVQKMRDYAAKAKELGCKLVVFPEMAVTGYPPGDLLTRRELLVAADKAVKQLARDIEGIAAIIGGPEYRVVKGNGRGVNVYNAAFFCDGQGNVRSRHKQNLVDFDLVDERRYFTPGSQETALETVAGLSMGISVGEDMEGPENPMEAQADAGADFLVNIGSFPYYFGQEANTQELLSQIARKAGKPVFWVNQVGANDEAIFAGQSLAVDGEGHICARGSAFQEELIVVEMEGIHVKGEMPPVTTNSIAMLHGALVLGIRDYAAKSGFSDVVIGLSGGLDSAITACLAVEALGKEHVHCVTLPSPYTSPQSITDAKELAGNLGCDLKVIPISDALSVVKSTLLDSFIDVSMDVAEENIQARLRGMFCMALANKYGWLLLNASNKSELAVGYATLYGDMSGSLAVLSDVYKSDLYRLADWINREKEVIPVSILTKPPSAELRPNQLDVDSLPPYTILDGILRLVIEEGKNREEVAEAGYPQETVDEVLRLLVRSEYKRRQAAPGLRVTRRGFGRGWRMPLVAKHQWLWDTSYIDG